MRKKAIFIILATGALTFGNSLFNGFVGDDELIVEKNDFYKSWANVGKLFSKAYILDRYDLFNQREEGIGSGEVSYRPVKSFTHFIDYSLWGENPFGYHLANFLIHIFNALLLYFLVLYVLNDNGLALLSALIFCVNPVQSETVCAINFRHGLLADMFVLLAFLSYLKSRALIGKRGKLFFLLSHVAYFLALFSKESALVFPLLIVLYDRVIEEKGNWSFFREFWHRYSWFIAVSVFYLYVYLKVFPNSTFSDLALLGGSIKDHVLISLQIQLMYIAAFFVPSFVKILTPGYAPAAVHLGAYKPWAAIILVFLLGYLFVKKYPRDKRKWFFVFWALVSLLPTSNLVPLPNPMAYRFMYLPSIGLAVVLAVVLNGFYVYLQRFRKHAYLPLLVKYGYIVICMGLTFSLNSAWKNNYIMAKHMVRDCPNNPKGYLYLGIQQYERKKLKKSRESLLKGLQLGLEDPRAYFFLGITASDDFDAARPFYEKCIDIFPRYAPAYIGLGRGYLFKGQIKNALYYLKKAVSLVPKYSAYGYLIQAYIIEGQKGKARAILNEAGSTVSDEKKLKSLSVLFSRGSSQLLPVDIGI